MSESIKCDNCENRAPRRRMYPCPDGWFYLEAKDDDDPNGTIIVWACSKECAMAQWKPGPGKRWTAEEVMSA